MEYGRVSVLSFFGSFAGVGADWRIICNVELGLLRSKKRDQTTSVFDASAKTGASSVDF